MKQCQNELQKDVWGYVRIKNCLIKALRKTENYFDTSTLEFIRTKLETIISMEATIKCVEYFLFELINQLQNLHQNVHMHVKREDYQNLQNAVQKSQAEIRKHIRLEQELKIYTDSLEEKVECLERDLQIESSKYNQLFESAKAMDLEKKELKMKLRNLEIQSKGSEQKDFRSYCQTASKFLTQYNEDSKKGHSKMVNKRVKGMKVRSVLEKSKDKKMIQSVQAGFRKEINDQIDVSLIQCAGELKVELKKTQIKNVETIQLREGNQKHSRKLLKYSTNQKIVPPYRSEARSSSVCN